MVSRVYTPMVTPYARPQAMQGGSPPVETKPERSPFEETPQAMISADNGDLQRQSAGLKAVQTNQFNKIPLDAVLHDFKSTIDALGADGKTRDEVTAYLQVVGLQGSKDNPEVPFVKHTLRTAANTLDQFIAQALGQPSQVVKEWVDALLLQDIDYRMQEPPDWLKASVPQGIAEAQEALPVQTPQFDDAAKARVKTLVDTAKTQFKQQNVGPADASLQQALDTLDPHEQPLWKGKVWQLRARFQEKTGGWEHSAASYGQAASHFETAERPDLQSDALYSAASILDRQGQTEQAAVHYQAVVALDAQLENSESLVNSLNDLGNLYLRQGNAVNAVATLEQAARETLKTPVAQPVQSDVLNNLGAAYRSGQNYDAAIQAFRQSLKLAQGVRDKSRYASTLQQLAATYVDNSQPELAMKALQKLTQLQNA